MIETHTNQSTLGIVLDVAILVLDRCQGDNSKMRWTHNTLPMMRLVVLLMTLQLAACSDAHQPTLRVGGTSRPTAPSQKNPHAATNPYTPNRQDPLPDPTLEGRANINRRLAEWYGVRSNYDLVYKDVLSFYPEGRYNGCVAFLSSALRRIGVDVPLDDKNESISLVTKPFSDYLEKKLGWKRVTSGRQLQAGDVVFTKDNRSYPGYPAHTYMFHSWSDKDRGLALVIDNQDFAHERNIYAGASGFNFTPFAYALRVSD
jgi:hypothetical protein